MSHGIGAIFPNFKKILRVDRLGRLLFFIFAAKHGLICLTN